jgi:RNA polymerase sigma-70 factor (ECF subfamily)
MTSEALGGSSQAALLEQVSWIRRLARELVADRELAEDLAQEACVVALERGPREAGKLRQWLAEVLRNALRQHARAAGRRRARESLAARPEALEPTDRLVERALVQRELVDAVLALEEPYRSTVLLRFFEELPPREIARRTATPLATVNSRLARALAQLRERLDGGQRAWAALLLPWAHGLEALGSPTLLTVLMKTKLALTAAALVLAAGTLVWWQAQPDERPRNAAAAALPESAAVLRDVTPGDRGTAEPVGEREAVPTEAAPATPEKVAESTVPAPSWTVRLRVLDADGAPMSGVAVRAEASVEVLGTSGAGGWCVFPTSAERLVLMAADPRWVTVHEGSPARTSSFDPVLVLAPAMSLAGLVRDEGGRALAQASVRFELPDGFRNRFTELLEATRPLSWRAVSEAEGRFSFERVPSVPGATLTAVLPGYERCRIEAPLASAHDLELVLTRPRVPLTGVLRGRVLDPAGAAVAGARVGLGLAAVVSDERGEFALTLARAVTAEVLTALKAGYLPARMERPAEPSERSSGWPDEVTLVLGGPPLTIRGVLLDHEGAPLGGARVWIHDPTPTTPIGQMPAYLEPLLAGASVPPAAIESEARLPEKDGDSFFDWYTNAHEPTALWNWVVTDSAGRFEVGGLEARRYHLDVLRSDSLEIVTTESFEAGEAHAVVRLGPPELFDVVSGRVLAENGEGLADVEVSLYRPVVDARARIFGGNSQVVLIEPGGTTVTDVEGRFHFERVPKHGAVVSVRGDAIVPRSAPVEGANVDVEVEQRCHFEVVLRDAVGRFDGIAMADGEGKPLDLLVLTEGSVNAWTSVSLVEGRSGVVSVSARARTLKLLKDRAVIETRPIDLVPGDVNRIEL